MKARTKLRARELRKNQTDAEQRLWYSLRNRQFCGLKFRRQYPIGGYVVDFACIKHHLVIELDGSQHLEQKEYDACRTDYLQACGYLVKRYWNHQVLTQHDSVLSDIYRTLFPSP